LKKLVFYLIFDLFSNYARNPPYVEKFSWDSPPPLWKNSTMEIPLGGFLLPKNSPSGKISHRQFLVNNCICKIELPSKYKTNKKNLIY